MCRVKERKEGSRAPRVPATAVPAPEETTVSCDLRKPKPVAGLPPHRVKAGFWLRRAPAWKAVLAILRPASSPPPFASILTTRFRSQQALEATYRA